MRPVPPGLFAPGGDTKQRPRVIARPIVPLEWLLSHPATFPWWGKAIRDNVGAGFITDTLLSLDNGYAGVVVFLKFIGNSGNQGANGGTNFLLLVNKVPVFRAQRQFGAAQDSGNMDDMGADDGVGGNSWGDVRVWLEEGAVVQARYNNNGGPANLALGIMARGYAWPISVYEQWVANGWRYSQAAKGA